MWVIWLSYVCRYGIYVSISLFVLEEAGWGQTISSLVESWFDITTLADRREGDVAERKRRREDQESSARFCKARRDKDTGKCTLDSISILA